MSAVRKIAAILAADIAGYSRLTGADEEGTLTQLRTLRDDLIDPDITTHRGRIVKTTGDGLLVEFASVVDAVRCAVKIQQGIAHRNSDISHNKRIEFRIGINLGDVVVEGDDLLGDGVNIAARIEGITQPGGICVSDDAYRHVRDKVSFDFVDMGDQQLKNIARPVKVFRVRFDDVLTRPTLSLPDKPSIAVLPFQNMSDDARQEYFADGMVEDIITALSRIRSLFVIARNSSFTYKGRAVDIKQVGRELGVRYVLEGSVRRAANRVRVTCQLIDSTTGSHIWSDRYDGDLGDIFKLQDEITQNTVAAIEPSLVSAEIARAKAKPTESLAAYDLYLRALPEFSAFTKEGFERAEVYLRQAVTKDPDYAEAWAMLADCLMRQINGGWVRNLDEAIVQSREAALRAVEADPQNGLVLSIAAFSLGVFSRLFDRASDLCERALVLQPNSAAVLTNCSWVLINNGDCDRALMYSSLARRLNPLDPRGYTTLGAMAAAHFFERRFEEAEKCARQALQINQNVPIALRFLAAALAAAGRVEDARAVMADLLRRFPTTSLGISVRIGNRDPTRRQLLIDALKKAGMPDEPPLPLPDKPSIAVLPFQNMSGDPEQDYFADGMVEDIITSLSRFRQLFVIARNSSFTYKGKSVDIRQVGRELGVRYVLEGSVRKLANRVRITGQLIDTTTGAHIWSDRFDGLTEDIFGLQDQITTSMVGAIAPALERQEIIRAKSKPTERLDAYDLFLRALPEFYAFTEAGFSAAEALLKEAVNRDPDYAEAWAMLADCIARQINGGWVKDATQAVIQNREAALHAVRADPEDGLALSIAGWSLNVYSGQLEQAVELCERALHLQPNSSAVLRNCAFVFHNNDESDRALALFQEARRLNPIDPRGYITLNGIAAAYFVKGEFAETERYSRRVLEHNPDNPLARRFLAAALVQLNRLDEAKAVVAELLLHQPNANLEWHRRIGRRNPAMGRDLVIESLKKAGLPD